ncbi:MAG: phosphatidate cytidylyltransferase, partial [Thermodesulfobacteriota bacterium]
IFLPHLPAAGCLFLFIAVSFAGQAGDLFESELKRVRQIKDSGNILPGHGGLLDRIDALLFAAPTAYLFKQYVLILF